ncbi:MAG: hypothetical protein ACM3O7_01985 [Acidobacteriota bacterium]
MIDRNCQEVREALENGASAISGFQTHLDGCPVCRRHQALLATLARLDTPPVSEARVAEIMSALPAAGWQRRHPATWLPLAAGLVLAALGLVLLGGLPASGAVAALPQAASGISAWLTSWILDGLAAVRGGADAVRLLLAAEGLWLLWMVLAAAAGGGLAVRALARRRRGGA